MEGGNGPLCRRGCSLSHADSLQTAAKDLHARGFNVVGIGRNKTPVMDWKSYETERQPTVKAPVEFDSLVIEFLRASTDAQLEMLAAILCDPAEGIKHARGHGLQVAHFADHDCRLIFVAIESQGAQGQDATLRTAWRLLQAEKFSDPYDRRDSIGGGCWSWRGLLALANRFNAGPCILQARAIEQLATKLIDFAERQADASDFLNAAVDRLTLPATRHVQTFPQKKMRIA